MMFEADYRFSLIYLDKQEKGEITFWEVFLVDCNRSIAALAERLFLSV